MQRIINNGSDSTKNVEKNKKDEIQTKHNQLIIYVKHHRERHRFQHIYWDHVHSFGFFGFGKRKRDEVIQMYVIVNNFGQKHDREKKMVNVCECV